MADIKISQLGAAVAVADADVIPATANGVTVKVPASVLKEYAIGGTDISSIGDGTPTGAISALKSVKIEKTDIAPIETSVASKAYAVGDQLYYNGMLYSVIAAIAQGETLVVDTNIELSDKVTEQIKALQGSVDLVNADLQKEVTTRAALGAHNLLNHIATTQVINGVTFTVNADKSITVNGTNNTDNDVTFALESRLPSYPNQVSKLYSNGDYILDGCPNGGSVETFFMYVSSTKNNSYYEYGIDTGNGLAFTINGDDYNADSAYLGIGITIGAHVTINNLTFYPMIRLASDIDPTYQPYAMTNRELTENVSDYEMILFTNSLSWKGSTITDLFGRLVRFGKLVIMEGYWEGSVTSNQPIITLPEKYKPTITAYGSGVMVYDSSCIPSIYMVSSTTSDVRQQTKPDAATKGSFTIVYLLG